MNRVLEAIAAERSELTARLQALEEMERLCRVFDADSPVEVEPRDWRRDLSADLARSLAEDPPARPRKLREPVRALPPVRRSAPERPRRKMASPSEMQQRAEKVLAAVRALEPCKSGAIAERAELAPHMVKEMLVRLRDEGLVRMTGPKNRHALWHLTETLDRQTAEKHGTRDPEIRAAHIKDQVRCREDVLSTIRSDPGQWTEQRIADTGAWDREQVADACGYLLNDGLVILDADGTYRPAMLGLEAAA
ncbi:MAG TPA: hypothetical protein VFH80_10275 [Solirubrobacteraceae bacterium]|nr:hypothetical protein [Solirubrobacteraceae bacterium]